ncbi:DNA polymerase III subunit epsilon-like [Hydra vulgaris]|uniref:DNA polymerase III subunit epsilon-like n=1 Tax=Hydra vulgaris TaxID=6087 RepID=A0ABM4D1C6_HYDVU
MASVSSDLTSQEYFQENIIILDVETTGLNASSNRIVQLAMLKIQNNGLMTTFDNYFNPCVSRQAQTSAFRVHGICPDMLMMKAPFCDYLKEIIDFIGETKYLCGHNVAFDWKFLLEEFTRADSSFGKCLVGKNLVLIDTLKLSRKAFPQFESYKLQSLSSCLGLNITQNDLLDLKIDKPVLRIHDAMVDVLLTKKLLYKVMQTLCSTNNSGSQQLSLSELLDKHYCVVAKKT